jgi:GNAT superfamily N-acetyltransferase
VPDPGAFRRVSAKIEIRALAEDDLDDADRIFRLAFGTFLGMPDPSAFMGDADLVHTRWHAAPGAALGAYADGALVGSNFAANWGSFGFFGPLTVRPDLWNSGVGRALLEPTMALFERWGTRHAGLYTFAQSAKHVSLYQRFDFWPQHLTAVMAKPVAPAERDAIGSRYSSLAPRERAECLEECRGLTASVFAGLDLRVEIEAVAKQGLGDTVLVRYGEELAAFAVCHVGAGSEAGSGAAYVKFGAARSGPSAAQHFEHLISACEEYAQARAAQRLVVGVNAARHEAYRALLAHGFRTFVQGVAMQRPNDPGWNRSDRYVLDDWR